MDVTSALGDVYENECNADLNALCDLIGQKYFYHCCNCLLRMGAITEQQHGSVGCCNSCR